MVAELDSEHIEGFPLPPIGGLPYLMDGIYCRRCLRQRHLQPHPVTAINGIKMINNIKALVRFLVWKAQVIDASDRAQHVKLERRVFLQGSAHIDNAVRTYSDRQVAAKILNIQNLIGEFTF